MRFRPYFKMPSASDARDQPSPGGTWVALEKIHGAQLVVAVRKEQVFFGKRKAWLTEDEPFFGWQLLRVQLSASARAVAHRVGAREDTVYLYGELFGGCYPHPDVSPLAGMSPVQTGIWYAPDLRWSPFDILVTRSEEDEGVFLAHHEVESAAREAGLLTPPIVRRGTRSEMSATPTRALTRVPSLLGLPPIDNNIAEGLVVKSDQRVSPNSRTSFKRKIEEFNEGRFDESEAWNPNQLLSRDELVAWAQRLVNPERIASALSKVGSSSLPQVIEETILDVRVDLELAFPLACRSLDALAEDSLSAHIRELAVPLVEKAFHSS